MVVGRERDSFRFPTSEVQSVLSARNGSENGCTALNSHVLVSISAERTQVENNQTQAPSEPPQKLDFRSLSLEKQENLAAAANSRRAAGCGSKTLVTSSPGEAAISSSGDLEAVSPGINLPLNSLAFAGSLYLSAKNRSLFDFVEAYGPLSILERLSC